MFKFTATIFCENGIRVDSYGNGAAYQIAWEDDTEGNVFLQGDDATAFRDEFDTADAIDDEARATRCKTELCTRYIG